MIPDFELSYSSQAVTGPWLPSNRGSACISLSRAELTLRSAAYSWTRSLFLNSSNFQQAKSSSQHWHVSESNHSHLWSIVIQSTSSSKVHSTLWASCVSNFPLIPGSCGDHRFSHIVPSNPRIYPIFKSPAFTSEFGQRFRTGLDPRISVIKTSTT